MIIVNIYNKLIMFFSDLLLVIGHTVDESHSATSIVSELAHVEQIIWIFLLLSCSLDAFMFISTMLFILKVMKTHTHTHESIE